MPIINFGFNAPKNQDERIPPGQSVVKGWPVLTYGPTPHIDTASWSLEMDGLVKTPTSLTWQTFAELPTTVKETDIHCVTRWSKLGMQWEGVSIDELIKLSGGLTDNAKYLIVSCYGGYTTNLPVADTINGQALVATKA